MINKLMNTKKLIIIFVGIAMLLNIFNNIATAKIEKNKISASYNYNNKYSMIYIKGRYLYNRYKYKKAILYLKKFIKKQSPIKDYALYLIAWSYYRLKNYNQALIYFSKIEKNHNNSRFYLESIKKILNLYLKLNKWSKLKTYLEYLYKFNNPNIYSVISYYYAIYFEHYKKNQLALNYYNKSLDIDNKKQIKKILNKIRVIFSKLKQKKIYNKIIKQTNLINLGKSYYKNNQYKKAIYILATSNNKDIDEKLEFERFYYILLSCLKIKEYKYSKDLLNKILPKFKDPYKKITLLYSYYSSLKKRNLKLLIKGYKTISKYKHPDSIKANIYLTNYYYGKKDYMHIKYLNYLADANQEKIIWKYFIKELNKKRFSYLIRYFPKIINKIKSQKVKSKFKYWLGIASLKLKNYKQSENFFSQSYISYKYNYYSYKSLLYIKHYNKKKIFNTNIENLKKQDNLLISKLTSSIDYKKRINISFNTVSKKTNINILNKAIYFYKTKLTNNFNIELKRFLEIEKNKAYYYRFLSKFFTNNNDYQKSIHYAYKLIKYINGNQNRNYIPEDIINIYYPKHYNTLISKYSSKYKVNSNLVFAVIREESRFNKKARSYVGARGLMQIMPKTGRYLSRLIKHKKRNLYNINTNLKLGSYYLSFLIKKFKSYSYALAAYNGGPTRMNKRLIKAKNNKNIINGEHIIELIKNNETRNYVKKVLTSFYAYMDLYNKLIL